MDDTKKLILLLVGAVILIVAAFWLITPLRSEGDLLSKMFGGGISVSEPTATGPELTIDLTREYTVEVETSEGMFTMVLYDNNAPFTVNNFVTRSINKIMRLINKKRIVPGFIIKKTFQIDNRIKDIVVITDNYVTKERYVKRKLKGTHRMLYRIRFNGFFRIRIM